MEYTPETKKEFDTLVQVFSRAREYGIPAEEIIKAMRKVDEINASTSNYLSQPSNPPTDWTYTEHE